jgi:hypothetical protein
MASYSSIVKSHMRGVALVVMLCGAGAALAHGPTRSTHSVGSSFNQASAALSALPFVVSVAAPAALLSAGAGLVVVSVTAVAEGSVWLLERTSDGARFSITLSGQLAGTASELVGAAVVVTAVSTGWVLSASGQLVAFVPNAVGKALFHNERLTHSTPRGVQ